MIKPVVVAAAAAMLCMISAVWAETSSVGAMASVQRTVYGVPPQGNQIVKRLGDPVIFKESLETWENSGALIRFIDASELTIGAKSRVLIDEFVFDPAKADGNALIRISVGTLRFVTGGMPKGGTVIETPTATLTLRGTDVVVHVHPDGTTDTTVNDGRVEAHNKVTNGTSNLGPGEGATLGNDGNSDFSGPGNQVNQPSDQARNSTPEQRRGGNGTSGNTQQANQSFGDDTPSGGGDDDGGEDEDSE